MKQYISIIMMLLLAILPTAASDFVVDAVHYRTLSSTTVEVAGYNSTDDDGSDVTIPIGSLRKTVSNASGYSVNIPATIFHKGVTYEVVGVGNSAFVNLYKMEEVTLPYSITTIGNSAFAGCSGLSRITCSASHAPAASANSFASVNKSICTLYVPLHSRSDYAKATGWTDFANIVELGFKITYKVDNEVYATDSIAAGAYITLINEPTKEGYTFSGWIGYPEDMIMPAHDVEVNGIFNINAYILTYKVDGELYKEYTLEYGVTITPEAEPTRDGYTFSGWSEIPATMPAHDVEVNGTFSVDSGLEEIEVGAHEKKYYDLFGRRVLNPQSGTIYLLNNKKSLF